MGAKKVKVTNELIRKLDSNGIEGMNRKELRALFRRGYVERQIANMGNGSVRYAYKIASNFQIKEA